jgi:hypothetical protein
MPPAPAARAPRLLVAAAALLACASAMTSFDAEQRARRAAAAAPLSFPPITEWPWTLATRPDRATPELDCPLRALVAAYAARLNNATDAADVARSLRLRELCPNASAALPPAPAHHAAARPRWEAPRPRRRQVLDAAGHQQPPLADAAGLCSAQPPPPIVIFVAPGGSDGAGGDGSKSRPFASLQRALAAVAMARGGDGGDGASAAAAAACVWMRGGTYRLATAATVTAGNLEIAAFPGESPLLSGALSVATPSWAPFGAAGGSCFVAAGAAPAGLSVSDVFDASGAMLSRARFPNTNVSGAGGAPYPTAWLAAGAFLDPPAAQQCESFLMQIGDARPTGDDKDPGLCFRNFTDAGGMVRLALRRRLYTLLVQGANLSMRPRPPSLSRTHPAGTVLPAAHRLRRLALCIWDGAGPLPLRVRRVHVARGLQLRAGRHRLQLQRVGAALSVALRAPRRRRRARYEKHLGRAAEQPAGKFSPSTPHHRPVVPLALTAT